MELFVEIKKQLPGFSLDVSFRSEQSTLGILGASGSGKSMTLRCIAGLADPDEGRISLNGRVLFDSARKINLPARKRRIGLLFQNYALFPHLTVAENIAFGLQKMPGPERKRLVAEKIALVRLEGLEDRLPGQISGGQQQRVALARALAAEPEALLLDEPFSALDHHLRSQMEKQLVDTLNEFSGVSLFVSHNLEEAYRICDQLLVVSRGQVVSQGSKEEIFYRPQTFAAAQITGCKNLSRAKPLGEGRVEAMDWGCTLQVDNPVPAGLRYVGIRSHHLQFAEKPGGWNVFPCELAEKVEHIQGVTLSLRLIPPGNSNTRGSAEGNLLQAEVPNETWLLLKERPQPWLLSIRPDMVFLTCG